MVIDLDKCIGCQTCAVICKMHHAQPQGTWWNRVFTQGSDYHQSAVGTKDGFKIEYLPVSCQMCDNAPCERVCPTGATYKNEEGMILVDYDRCIDTGTAGKWAGFEVYNGQTIEEIRWVLTIGLTIH